MYVALLTNCGVAFVVGAPLSEETVIGALAATVSVLPKKFVLNGAASSDAVSATLLYFQTQVIDAVFRDELNPVSPSRSCKVRAEAETPKSAGFIVVLTVALLVTAVTPPGNITASVPVAVGARPFILSDG
ncbi:hypothetical protein PGS49_22390 [Yersinia intermedia]|uniref:hypothetical protein n=1 Tax=Yersinia intermedia TaxID=631 RepID=UPI0022FF3818|nr:hypothetical protein [Yersinia intermedia]MDA5483355.1 hypothetical protein [Yersinia intermedia]